MHDCNIVIILFILDIKLHKSVMSKTQFKIKVFIFPQELQDIE